MVRNTARITDRPFGGILAERIRRSQKSDPAERRIILRLCQSVETSNLCLFSEGRRQHGRREFLTRKSETRALRALSIKKVYGRWIDAVPLDNLSCRDRGGIG